jgi:hypothetical protein
MPKSIRNIPLKMPSLALLVLLAGMLGTHSAFAEACTYREAIMALERGNVDRGLALMRMASRDGDRRAERYLLEQDYAQGVITKDYVVTETPPAVASASTGFK